LFKEGTHTERDLETLDPVEEEAEHAVAVGDEGVLDLRRKGLENRELKTEKHARIPIW